jgi:hypothetical protein
MEESAPTAEQDHQKDLQRTQLKMDLVKHVSTLSSGAIVILATFLTKRTPPAAGSNDWLLASVVSLIASLVASLVYFWAFGLLRQFQRPQRRAFADPMEKITGFLLALAFCSGILSLGVFVIKNSK